MMILTSREFSRIGELLAGPAWRKWLADKLDRSERTIRYYERGEINIPPGVRARIAALCRQQAELLLDADRLLSGKAETD